MIQPFVTSSRAVLNKDWSEKISELAEWQKSGVLETHGVDSVGQ